MGEDVDDRHAPSARRGGSAAACSRRRRGTSRRSGTKPPSSARPFRIAPIACSRMPKWRLRPPNCARWIDARALDRGLGRRLEVGRAADEPRHELRRLLEHLRAERARRVDGAVRPARAAVRSRSAGTPARGRVVPLRGERRVPRSRHAAKLAPATPRAPRGCARRERAPVRAHLVGHEERRLERPARAPPSSPSTSSAPSGAPCASAVSCLCGAPLRDVRAGDDQAAAARSRRPPRRAPSAIAAWSWPSIALHVPAVGLEARADVLGERELGVALDRDVVVVVEERRGCRARGGRRARRPRTRRPPSGRRRCTMPKTRWSTTACPAG